MTFQEYLNQAWSRHAQEPQNVASEYNQGLQLVSKPADLSALARLIVHVSGEHLGQYANGIQSIEQLKENSFCDEVVTQDLVRSESIFKLCQDGDRFQVVGGASEVARIYATSAGVMTGQKQITRASQYLHQALKKAESLSSDQDPAYRALAITGNNLACELEEKTNRSTEEKDLMILAALTARKYWEKAGGPEEVAIAEYRLASSYLKAENLEEAFRHAQIAVELSENMTPYNQFYQYEILAKVEKARGNQTGFAKAREKVLGFFNQLSDQEKSSCEASLKKLV